MRQLLFILLLTLPAIAFCTEGNKNPAQPKILVAAASHNVSSDYYPISMLAQDMKIAESSLEKELNSKLIATITNNSQLFIPVLDNVADNPKEFLSQNLAVAIVQGIADDVEDHYSTIELLEIDKLYPQMQKCSKKISKNILAKIAP